MIYNSLEYLVYHLLIRRDGRVVEGVRLESVCACKRTAGSNPVLSAILRRHPFGWLWRMVDAEILSLG